MTPLEVNIDKLDQFLSDGRRAARYAWDHYEELLSCEHTYTLYGAKHYGTGAAIPGRFTPLHARKLSDKTRRKNFTLYELDSEFNLLRTKTIRNYNQIDCVYLCFDLDGVQYAYPFGDNQKKVARDEVLAVKWENGKPQYLGFLCRNSLILQFFQHESPKKMYVTTYSYSPKAKCAANGGPPNRDAPLGAPDSPVQIGFWEEYPAYTDFSCWFRDP